MEQPSEPGCSAEDLALIEGWRATLERNPLGRRLLKNLAAERNVPSDLEKQFWRNLAARLRAGDDPVPAALDNAIQDSMLLQGPAVPEPHLQDRLSRVLTIRRLMSYVADNVPLHIDREGEEQLYEDIKDGVLPLPSSFKNELLRGYRPLVWATFSEEIDQLYNREWDTDQLCDWLGLLIGAGEYIIELQYSRDTAGTLLKPTVLDAGSYPAFSPSEPEEPYGFTENLLNPGSGVPEFVHRPFLFHEIKDRRLHGQKRRQSSITWPGEGGA